MNEEVEKTLMDNLSQLIEWIKSGASATGQFLQEQTPLFVQEYLNWIFWENCITFCSITIAFTVFLTIAIKCSNSEKFKTAFTKSNPTPIIFITVISWVITIILTVSMFAGGVPALKEMIKVKVAPRVVLVEKIKDLTGR